MKDYDKMINEDYPHSPKGMMAIVCFGIVAILISLVVLGWLAIAAICTP
jgi:hypothetical protein